MSGRPCTFPLLSRRRPAGLAGRARASAHRGGGYEIASSRPYQRGDSVRTIDWRASARLSTARLSDDFIVREHFAEEQPRAVILVDRRPEMRLFPSELPWLSKPAAVRVAGTMIVDSVVEALGLAGYLDVADPHRPAWLAPRGVSHARRVRDRLAENTSFTASQDNVAVGLRFLVRLRRHLPAGSFVFVLSDFLAEPALEAWELVATVGWDVIPVIVQDPRWEQSFPVATGVALPLVGSDGRVELVRLTRRESLARRAANERRLATLQRTFTAYELDWLLLSSADPDAVHASFMAWHARRVEWMRRT